MTDQSGWGGWSPDGRPDERTPQQGSTPKESASPAPQADRGSPESPGTPETPETPETSETPETPETSGTPHTYGAPSYGAPTYGGPAEPGGRHGTPEPRASADEPTRAASYDPPAAYQQPTPQPTPPSYGPPDGGNRYGGDTPYGGDTQYLGQYGGSQTPGQQPGNPYGGGQQPGNPYGGGQTPGQQPGNPYGGNQYGADRYGAPAGEGTSSAYGGYAPPPQSNAPADQQPTQQFNAYGYGGTPPPAGGQPPYGGYGSPPPPPPPAKKRSGRRIALVLGIVVILVAGLGVGAWALFLRGGPAVTWQGKEVANPEQVLTEAQGDLDALVSDAKGAKGADTRCYYAVPKSSPKDTPKTDVGDTLYCGPALFVDGDTAKPYIPYGLSAGAAKDDKVTLTITAKGNEGGATSVPATQKLVRPDGASAPNGAGGLKVPEPPPADENVFTSVDDLDVPAAPRGATMGSLTGGVTITKLGEVKRYGTGSDARSAPDGQKLIAFQLDDAPGDGASDGASALDLTVSVDGGGGQDIPDLTGINVIAVPTDAKAVDLVTSADSVKQSLSLLTGKPGSGNLAVLARANRIGSFTPPKTFAFTETGGGASAARPCTLTGSVAGLFYWVDDKGSAHASAPGNAVLETDLKYTFSTDSPPPFTGSSAGDSATFEPSHLTLTLPTGAKVPAKVVSDHTVFEVPAGFTEGTITVGGAYTNANGITFTVTAPVSFKVSIPTS